MVKCVSKKEMIKKIDKIIEANDDAYIPNQQLGKMLKKLKSDLR